MNRKLLMAFLETNTESIINFFIAFLEKLYPKVITDKENYVYAEGVIPILLMGHADTVSPHPSRPIYSEKTHMIYPSPNDEILGADDRAGLAAIVEILQRGYLPSVLITNYEELLGVGIDAFIGDVRPTMKYQFALELDRQGRDDFVCYNTYNKDFKNFISSFGFKEAKGSFSDNAILETAWDLASCNLSVGYQHEHTPREVLHLDWLEETIDKVCHILSSANTEYYTTQAPDSELGLFTCSNCGKKYPAEYFIPIEKEPICNRCYFKSLGIDKI